MDNVQTPDAGQQPSLFPEDETPMAAAPVAAVGNPIAQQLASMPPEQLSQLAASLPPDIRSALAQSLFAAMSPEEKQAVDAVPGADVVDNMQQAEPQRPEAQYQMSVLRTQKKLSGEAGMQVLATDHVERWKGRVVSLHEDGYIDDDSKKTYLDRFDHKENRFSVLIDGGGLLRDSMKEIEALEKSRAGQATLSKSVLQNRFSGTRPIKPPAKRAGELEDFDQKAAEEAGSRLASMY